MKMKKIIYLFTLTIAFVSCSDYLDVNETTNSPLAENIPARLILPGAQVSSFRIQTITMNSLGSIMSNSWAANVNSYTGANSREYTQSFDNTFYSGIWDGLYTNLSNFQKIINDPNPKQENYKAISKILKAYYMQYIVDLYGDAPYTEAFKGQANLTPKYSDDKEIYRALVKELEEARTLIENSPNADEATTDVMLGGNMAKWISFANTVELRILLRQSRLTDSETVTYRNTKLAELVALNDFITEDITINPGFSAANDDAQNPFFGTLVNSAGQTQQTYLATTASGHLATFLNGTQSAPYNTAGLVDPRRVKMFTQISGAVSGVIQGDVTQIAGGTAPKTVSKLGIGITGLVSGAANGGNGSIVNGSSRNGFVMLASESYFLQAEAAVRYPAIFTADAHALFNSGVAASFKFFSAQYVGANATNNLVLDATPYLAASDSYNGIGWTGSSDKVEAIITQKWLALAGIHGIEPYLDLIRTGYPLTPMATTAAPGATKPKRLLYPQSENISNTSNVPNIVLSQIFEQGAFWTK